MEAGVVLMVVALASPAQAFSDLARYAAPTSEGGTAGRHFTGSTLDGYGCDACHQGGEDVEVAVSGLPLDGYVPGASYEITLRFIHPDPHVALLLEFTDEQQRPAGAIGPPDVATIPPEEFCQEDGVMTFPALMPVALDDGRFIVAVADCGARAVRFIWTAPPMSVGTIWMTGGAVQSDEQTDPQGDGVSLIRRPLVSGIGGAYAREVASGCSLAGRPRAGATGGALSMLVGMVFWTATRSRRSLVNRQGCRGAGAWEVRG